MCADGEASADQSALPLNIGETEEGLRGRPPPEAEAAADSSSSLGASSMTFGDRVVLVGAEKKEMDVKWRHRPSTSIGAP